MDSAEEFNFGEFTISDLFQLVFGAFSAPCINVTASVLLPTHTCDRYKTIV